MCVVLQIEKHKFIHTFLVCDDVSDDLILGRDFQKNHECTLSWSAEGHLFLTISIRPVNQTPTLDRQQQRLCKTRLVSSGPPSIAAHLPQNVALPAQSIVNVVASVPSTVDTNHLYESLIDPLLKRQNPRLGLLAMNLFNLPSKANNCVILTLVNFTSRILVLRRGTRVAHLVDRGVITRKATKLPPSHVLRASEPVKTPEHTEPSSFMASPVDQEVEKIVPPSTETRYKLTPKEQEQFDKVKASFTNVFSTSSADLGRVDIVEMEIDTGDHRPIAQKPYTVPLKHRDWVQKELEMLEEAGIIERSVSPWASPIVIVPKKSIIPGEPPRRRMCVDYRALNSLLPSVQKVGSEAKGVLSLVPLPKIDELFGLLKGKTIFSTMDIRSGFHHLTLTPESQKKSAFVTPYGKYQFKRVPFGLAQAPAYFQRCIDQVIAGYGHFALAYLDDILVFSDTVEQHIDHLSLIFNRLVHYGMRLKEDKCTFFSTSLHYLGHLISAHGIKPMQEKISSIVAMEPPKDVKQLMSFLGMAGYYRKFIPRYSDFTAPLTSLLSKDNEFEWKSIHQDCFNYIKTALSKQPILCYPDPNEPYFLYTDASKYGWAGVLLQESTFQTPQGPLVKLMPIQYVSGKFRGPALKWATLVKEAYGIYQSVLKLRYYLEGCDQVIVRTDHKPLVGLMNKTTKNNKVDNWSIELQQFQLKIEHVSGLKNELADPLSRLLQIDDTFHQPDEEPGMEFGIPVEAPEGRPSELAESCVRRVCSSEVSDEEWHDAQEYHEAADFAEHIRAAQSPDLTSAEFTSLWRQGQATDPNIQDIIKKVQTRNGSYKKFFLDKDLLYYKTVVGGTTFHAQVLPKHLIPELLTRTHDHFGHNSERRMYLALKKLYYWTHMVHDIQRHCVQCSTCRNYNKASQPYLTLSFEIPQVPMEFIAMDLIGPFVTSSRGNKYALTVIDMFTSYAFCCPLENKTADAVVTAYLTNVFCLHGSSRKILSDNGTEFQNDLHSSVCELLGVEARVFSPAYRPQSNGKIEGFHGFLKTVMRKLMMSGLEWDEIIPHALSAYNLFPGDNTKEAPYFLMHGRDPILPINTIIAPRVRYLGDSTGRINLEALRNIHQITAQRLKQVRKDNTNQTPARQPKVGDLVLAKDHTAAVWEARYKGPYRVVKVTTTRAELLNDRGDEKTVHLSDIKVVDPGTYIASQVPDYLPIGRAAIQPISPDAFRDLLKIHDSLQPLPDPTGTDTTKPATNTHKYNLRPRK